MNVRSDLVKNIMTYGAEIWGGKKYGAAVRFQDKFIIYGLDWNTSGYILRKETKRQFLRIKNKRTIKF